MIFNKDISLINCSFSSPEPSSSPSGSSMMQFPTLPSTAEESPEHGPPPLPPRHRDSSSSMPDPPPRPPDLDRPPPVPPRRDSMPLQRSNSGIEASRRHPHMSGSNTLPRLPSQGNFPLPSMDLPERHLSEGQRERPELPPRTYRQHIQRPLPPRDS